MKRVSYLLAALFLATASLFITTTPAAAGCIPNRGALASSFYVEQRMTAQSGVVLHQIEATIEEDRPWLVINGQDRMFLQLREGGTSPSYVRLGIDYTWGAATRIFMVAYEPSGSVSKYYTYNSNLDNIQPYIKYITSTKYEVWNGSTKLDTIFFDVGWTPTVASKWATSNNNGNQVPGTQADDASITSATYTSQYGTATLGGVAGSIRWPSGAGYGFSPSYYFTAEGC